MELSLTGRHFEVTPALKTHVEEKFASVQQRFAQVNYVSVVLHIEHLEQVAEATLRANANSFEIHAKASAEDMYSAIDALVEKLLAQLIKHKEKLIEHHRQ